MTKHWPFGETERGRYADGLDRLAKNPSSALELGKAAEHLACADLILQGHRAYLSDQGLPYDIVVDLKGHLIRVQSKAACFAKNVNKKGRSERLAYSFSVRRRGKGGDKWLANENCAVIALVALDRRLVAYLPIREVGITCQLMPPGFEFRGKYKRNRFASIDGFPFSSAVGRLP